MQSDLATCKCTTFSKSEEIILVHGRHHLVHAEGGDKRATGGVAGGDEFAAWMCVAAFTTEKPSCLPGPANGVGPIVCMYHWYRSMAYDVACYGGSVRWVS